MSQHRHLPPPSPYRHHHQHLLLRRPIVRHHPQRRPRSSYPLRSRSQRRRRCPPTRRRFRRPCRQCRGYRQRLRGPQLRAPSRAATAPQKSRPQSGQRPMPRRIPTTASGSCAGVVSCSLRIRRGRLTTGKWRTNAGPASPASTKNGAFAC